MRVLLDGAGDKEAPCNYVTDPTCDGVRTQGTTVTGKYNDYTVEVVQQIGADSFDPGHGVLFAKTKNTASSCGSFSCFVWFIDAHPEDINKVDYIGPDGQPVKATAGDERQKNDATFNVGLNSGTLSEYEDTANRLHFYVIDKHTDAQGVLHYKVAVKSLDGAGPQTRGVALGAPALGNAEGYSTCTFNLTNTGAAATTPNVHPQDASAFLSSDVYKLSDERLGHGLERVPQERAGDGEVRRQHVGPGLHREGHRLRHGHAHRHLGQRPVQDGERRLHAGRLRPRRHRPATLALTLGSPGELRPVHPGPGQGLLRHDLGERDLHRG